MGKIIDLERWRVEIELAEDFRAKEFGEYSRDKISKAGYNIEYYEKGYSGITYGDSYADDTDFYLTTLNLYHAIIKNIVPSLHFKNPKVLAFPLKSESQDTAPIVSATLNHYYKELEVDAINNLVIWDAYVLGYGISKIGYVTKFGTDIADNEKKPKSIADKLLEKIGLKEKEEKEKINPEINLNIEYESPYVSYVSPFNFGKDPRARSIDESQYVYEKFRKTVKSMKGNNKYKNTEALKGSEPNITTNNFSKMSQSEIEDFRTIELYEIHYRTEDGIYLLVLSKDGETWRDHYHEKSIYQMRGWQYEELNFNKHGHKLYAISDMTKIRNFQDRFTTTVDAILEQVDRFVPKIAYNETEVTENGKLALRDGEIGALVGTNKDPNVVFKELNFTQVKGDLKALTDNLIDLVTIQTGLTRAQLTGVSVSNTATEASISQGGQTLRLDDMSNYVNKYLKKQASKMWDIVVQFVELDELEMINGVSGVDETTGAPKYNWLNIDPNTADRIKNGKYDIDIEVGSTQKPDLSVIRKQFENMFNILARTDVIALMQQQGKKVDLAELLRLYIQLFPEMVKDVGKIIQNINQNTTGLVNPQALNSNGGGQTQGSNNNALESQMAAQVPNQPNQIGASF